MNRTASPNRPLVHLTRIQIVAVVVGLAIALRGVTEGPALSGALRLVGYPVACAAIVRWVPIVRQRLVGWLVVHELAMAAICAGWVLSGNDKGAIGNGLWGVLALVWWLAGGRQSAER